MAAFFAPEVMRSFCNHDSAAVTSLLDASRASRAFVIETSVRFRSSAMSFRGGFGPCVEYGLAADRQSGRVCLQSLNMVGWLE